ncbi:hypothetical protein F4861DRAFT_356816 [Xylaria intraflava]|nr:hypothetical protein F4861DRAFT_356816 [Xylaria intraflava]
MMNRKEQNTLMDRHNKIMAEILTRFRNMVIAATEPLPGAAAIPRASLNAMTMSNEVSALIKEVENLLALNREIKQLWIAGPLRKPRDVDEEQREKEIDERAARVSKLYNMLLEMTNDTARQAAQAAAEGGQRVEVKGEKGNVRAEYGN